MITHLVTWLLIQVLKIMLMKNIIFFLFIFLLGLTCFSDYFFQKNKSETSKNNIDQNYNNELAWLKKQIHPLNGFDPNALDNSDLDVLEKIIGDEKVIALGEVTHGSSEIFQMKHRIIKYLNEHKEFDILSMEASMPEAYEVNEYTMEGKGNALELIRGMHFWIWRTQEVLEMVEWMKQQNIKGKPIKFTGFDMQFYTGAIKNLKIGFTGEKYGKTLTQELDSSLVKLDNQNPKTIVLKLTNNEQEEIDNLLLKIRKEIISSSFDASKREWLLQNVRIIEQCLDNGFRTRDKYMAENVEWIKKQNPNSKIVLWGHNYHIKETSVSMGKYLSDKLKDDYLSIGFAFHTGTYSAKGEKGLSVYQAKKSFPGTYEYFFQAIDTPFFLLDLREIEKDTSKYGDWLKSEKGLKFRKTGAVKPRLEFSWANLKKDFDILIFINESSNSEILE